MLWDLSRNESGVAGDAAYQRIGRLPSQWSLARPFQGGVVADYEAALSWLRPLLERQPKVAWAAPVLASEIELQAGCDLLKQAGAASVTLIPATLAVLPEVQLLESEGLGVLLLGHELAQLSVYARSASLYHTQRFQAGAVVQQRLRHYVLQRHALELGQHQLDLLLPQLALDSTQSLEVRGKDLLSGLPRRLQLSQRELSHCLQLVLESWLEMLREMMLELPPPAVQSLLKKGLLLAGGLAQLQGLSEWLSEQLEMPVELLEQPQLAVVRGLRLWKEQSSQLDWSRLQ